MSKINRCVAFILISLVAFSVSAMTSANSIFKKEKDLLPDQEVETPDKSQAVSPTTFG